MNVRAGEAAQAPVRAGLVLGALGVVFGDIGTSPLYTLQECLASKHGVPPEPANVVGVVSLVCWAQRTTKRILGASPPRSECSRTV